MRLHWQLFFGLLREERLVEPRYLSVIMGCQSVNLKRSNVTDLCSTTVNQVIANGQFIDARLPCTIEEFLVAQGLLPRSVVVEHNGEAVSPSEFSQRRLNAGDRLEIVKIVAGG